MVEKETLFGADNSLVTQQGWETSTALERHVWIGFQLPLGRCRPQALVERARVLPEPEGRWFIRTEVLLWLVWLSGLSAGLQTKGSPVQFPVRAHAWVVGQVPSRDCVRGNQTLMFFSLSFSLPSPLSVKKKKKKKSK